MRISPSSADDIDRPAASEAVDLVAGLNAEQRRVVLHERGPLLVLAGPGSGKTRVITRHIAYRLLVRAAHPTSILAITFTNRAADEMRQRVHELIGEEVGVPCGTFHWMASTFLRRYANLLGFARDFRLLSPREAREVAATVVPPRWNVFTVMTAISAVKNGEDVARAALDGAFAASDLRATLHAYNQRLRTLGALDLDDLLTRSVELLEDDDALRARVRARISALLVDEFQDTNRIQARFVQLLAPLDRTVIAVGDDDQAIYGWRGAGAGSQLFQKAFPDAEVAVLGESYRHTKYVLRAAASLIEHNTAREPKALRTARAAGRLPVAFTAMDEIEEAEWIARRIAQRQAGGVVFREMAVLYRTNAQSRVIEDALVRAGIPYRILAGSRFYERSEVRHALAYLRLALDPGDDRAAATLFGGVRGVGEVRLEELREAAGSAGVSLLALVANSERPAGVPPAVWLGLTETAARAAAVIAERASRLPQIVQAAVASSFIDLGGREVVVEEVIETLDELRALAGELHRARGTLRGLIDRTSMAADSIHSRDGVNLLSLHAAKGLEFDVVFVAGLEEGLLPHRRSLDNDEDIEEERRLLYVGMTRARDQLALSHARVRFRGGNAFVGGPSRFLTEIGAANLRSEGSPRAAARPRLTSARPGDRIQHQRWGAGTIVSVEGRGRDTMTIIDFETVGRQRLQLIHAPLTLLQGADDH